MATRKHFLVILSSINFYSVYSFQLMDIMCVFMNLHLKIIGTSINWNGQDRSNISILLWINFLSIWFCFLLTYLPFHKYLKFDELLFSTFFCIPGEDYWRYLEKYCFDFGYLFVLKFVQFFCLFLVLWKYSKCLLYVFWLSDYIHCSWIQKLYLWVMKIWVWNG